MCHIIDWYECQNDGPPDLSAGMLLEGGIDMVAANPAPLQSHGINRG